MTLASFLSTCGCMPSLLAASFPCSRLICLFQGPEIPERQILPVRTEAQWALSTSAISMPAVTVCCASHSAGPCCPYSSEVVDIPVEAFLIAFHVPHCIQLQMGFGVPNPITAHLDSVSIPPGSPVPATISCYVLIDEFCQELPVHLCRCPDSTRWDGQFLSLEEVILEEKSNSCPEPLFSSGPYSM